jgi:hypothetical protein
LVPSADEATEDQGFMGAMVCVHVWAETALTLANRPQTTGDAKRMNLTDFIALSDCLHCSKTWIFHQGICAQRDSNIIPSAWRTGKPPDVKSENQAANRLL